MSELNAFDITVAEEGYCEGYVKYRRSVYDKSEADKVIAELRAQIVQADAERANALKEKLVEHATLREWAELQLRHQKYKRCLDKANYWGLVASCTHGLIQLKCMRRELKFRKLAEKFKEAN